MPIDTDVETRMKCFGKQEIIYSPKYCILNCCMIERDICYYATVDRLDKEIGDEHK